MKVVAAILMAGKSERFGSNKLKAPLGGKPLWRWSFDAFLDHPDVAQVGIVCCSEDVDMIREDASPAAFIVAGGSSRQESSRAALDAIEPSTDVLLLHDGARPFVTARTIASVIQATVRAGASAPGLAPTDTIKERGPKGLRTLDRSSLVAVQTPQGFRPEILRESHRLSFPVTDDLTLAEAVGIEPEIVEGDPANIKITFPEDLALAEARLQPRRANDSRDMEYRTGFGYDIHPVSREENRKLFLGGVLIEAPFSLHGHSDADVLLHAITDALLGAGALGDIGTHFPNTEARWKDESSATFLSHAARLLADSGWSIQNVDATLVAEAPRIAPHVPAIRDKIASILGLSSDRVSIKATTNEGLGSLGRGEGMAAHAVAAICRQS